MCVKRVLGCCVIVLLSVASLGAAVSELADAAMKRNKEAVRFLLQRKARRCIGRCARMIWKLRIC